MSEDWYAAAADIAAGIASVGMICTLRRPETDGPDDPWGAAGTGPTFHEITAMQTKRKVKDANGTLIGVTQTVLMMGAGSVIPTKADYIARNTLAANVTSDTIFEEISEVEILAPAGVTLRYEIILAN